MSKPDIDMNVRLSKACRIALDIIAQANRISFWRLSEEQEAIECIICYDSTTGRFSSGQRLNKSDFPDYFSAIMSNSTICANDAHSHPSTQCFSDTYFAEHDIHSLLDYILFEDLTPTGVVCCESVGRQVEWSDEDISNMRKIANVVSMFFH
ncbi:GAF domain-containing protein [Aestuariibacter salexigens]|uniref:GAF domain-containing protein n=1 Tax=Aestuariibacter salexigens TaxID=226010 RepID=UPI0012EB74C0|nr:GAF domain-containing protein [Aestuariibacter salexigens]